MISRFKMIPLSFESFSTNASITWAPKIQDRLDKKQTNKKKSTPSRNISLLLLSAATFYYKVVSVPLINNDVFDITLRIRAGPA